MYLELPTSPPYYPLEDFQQYYLYLRVQISGNFYLFVVWQHIYLSTSNMTIPELWTSGLLRDMVVDRTLFSYQWSMILALASLGLYTNISMYQYQKEITVVEKFAGINHTLFIATIMEGGIIFVLLVAFVLAYHRFSHINYGEQQ